MAIQKFLIAPLEKGQEQRFKPWLIADNAYQSLRNCYTWRGSVKKRFGAHPMNTSQAVTDQQLFTRLRVKFVDPENGNPVQTSGTGAFGPTVIPGAASTRATLGKMFSVDTTTYTVWKAGAPADTKACGTGTATYNTATGALTIVGGPANADVYYYPSDPVMNFGVYNVAEINDETTFAFDTQFAYTFTYATGWDRSVNTSVFPQANDTWTGSNSEFFWTTNYRGATSDNFIFFVTNNVAADAMRYWNGTDWNAWGSVGTTPIDTAGVDFIKTCAIIEPFKGRLLLFNVTENLAASDKVFRNRIRYSAEGSPFSANAWNQDIVGGGNYVEAPVKESITSVQFIKDRCIVFYESSTWELVYTGNKNQPFILQQLDSELGVESMNSVIHFDKAVLGFGNVGIHACNGLNVERIDELIPSTIFEVSNSNSGPQRVTGVRDYYNELAYWSYPSIDTDSGANQVFPTRILVYNYTEDNWSYNDDSITAFGFYQLTQDLIWSAVSAPWLDLDLTWNDPSTQNRFRSVLGGNQQGWTFVMHADFNNNAMSLQITNLVVAANIATITSYNHNLEVNSYVFIQNVTDDGTVAAAINGNIYQVQTTNDVDTFTINLESSPTGLYGGCGIVTRVSEIDILTKQYNFFYDKASNMAINQVDFYVDKNSNTAPGQVTVDFYLSTNTNLTIQPAIASGALLGTSILETTPYALVDMEIAQNRYWHTIYPNFYGENIQLHFYWTDDQIRSKTEDPDDATVYDYIAFQDFQLNAMIFYVEAINQLGG